MSSIKTIKFGDGLSNVAALTEDGSLLITGSNDTMIQVWKVELRNIYEYPISTPDEHFTYLSPNKDLGMEYSFSLSR